MKLILKIKNDEFSDRDSESSIVIRKLKSSHLKINCICVIIINRAKQPKKQNLKKKMIKKEQKWKCKINKMKWIKWNKSQLND